MTVIAKPRVRTDPAARRAQIIDEAIRIIGKLGYYGFTVQALAERCGISNAGLLYYFGSKDRLLLALLDEFERREEEVMAPLVALADDELRSGAANQAAVIGLLRTIVVRFAERPDFAMFVAALQAESIEPEHPAHAWFQDREVEALALFTRLLAGMSHDPASTARQLDALMKGLGLQWLRCGQTFDLACEWDKAVRAILPEPNA